MIQMSFESSELLLLKSLLIKKIDYGGSVGSIRMSLKLLDSINKILEENDLNG